MSQPLSYSAALSGKQENQQPPSGGQKTGDDRQQRPQQRRSSPPNQGGSAQGAAFEQGRNIPNRRFQNHEPSAQTVSHQPLRQHKSPDRHQNDAHSSPQTRHNHGHTARSQHTQTQPHGAESGGYTAEEYQRSSTHQANTSIEQEDYYILTLLLSKPLHDFLTSLRNTHFPHKINKLAAHISLFRALPGSQLPTITSTIREIASETPCFEVAPETEPFRMKMGLGVHMHVGVKEAQTLQGRLKDAWTSNSHHNGDLHSAGVNVELGRKHVTAQDHQHGQEAETFLSSQDLGGFKAHVTIMNKVDDEGQIKGAMQDVKNKLMTFEMERREKGEKFEAVGLGLWRYDKGFWRWTEGFDFGG